MSEEPSSAVRLVPSGKETFRPGDRSARPALPGNLFRRRLRPGSARSRGKTMRVWPFVAALGVMLAGMHLALHAGKRNAGADAATGPRLGPPPGLSRDEKARFWCYAAYAPGKLRERFMVPKGAAWDRDEARANLERMLAAGIGEGARAEILALRRARPAIPFPSR